MSAVRDTSTADYTSDASGSPTARLTRRNKIGLILAIVLGLGDLPSVLLAPSGDDVGPPMPVLILATLCGVVTVVSAWFAWRTVSRPAIRLIAGSRILSAITSLPAFFVGPPVGLLIVAAVGVIITIIAIVLLLAPAGPQPLKTITD
jgi:hypothetical protein